jgi:hypothetical protein
VYVRDVERSSEAEYDVELLPGIDKRAVTLPDADGDEDGNDLPILLIRIEIICIRQNKHSVSTFGSEFD